MNNDPVVKRAMAATWKMLSGVVRRDGSESIADWSWVGVERWTPSLVISDRNESMEEEVVVGILSDMAFVTSLMVSANEFKWMEAFVRRLLSVGGMKAFVCPMSSSDATAELLKIIAAR